MRLAIPAEYRVPHYPNRAERLADLWLHVVALTTAAIATLVLVGLAQTRGNLGMIAASALYGAALVTMLGFSTAYNMSRISPARPFLRRLDEAGIFLLIAASYTPFTTQRLSGAWAVGMTIAVWLLATVGVIGKLAAPRVPERIWTGLYIAFGWVALVAIKPLIAGVPATALVLLLAGGLIYTAGAWLFHRPTLPFRRAVWHACVVVAAGVHYAAVLRGVVLAS